MRGKLGRTPTQQIEIFDKTGCGENETDKTTTVVAYSKGFVFRIVDIGGKNNQCLQFALHVFYKDVDETSVATILWNLVKWSNTNTTLRFNDNAFVFNRMLGYNIAFYCEYTEQWYWDEVNPLAATCFIKFKHEHFEYIQPLRRHNGSDPIDKEEQVLPKAKVLPTAPVLEGIVKHIIPLYIHVMAKSHTIVTTHPTTNLTMEDEFQIKTAPRLDLPLFRIGKGVITDHIDFSLMNDKKE